LPSDYPNIFARLKIAVFWLECFITRKFGVSRQVAVMLMKSESPSAFMKERIDGKCPFQRVWTVRNSTAGLISHLVEQFVAAFGLCVLRILYFDPTAASVAGRVWRMLQLGDNALKIHAAGSPENIAAVTFDVIAE
jgi:hypothetical protein